MDSYSLKITWKVELWQELKIDTNYNLAVQGSIVNESHSPNHDWTLSKTYSLKPVHVLISDELWDTIKAKDPRSNSVKLRSLLKYKWDNWLAWISHKEFDDFYDSFYREIYDKMDYLLSNS
jgi:hypothetical protein